MLINKVFVYGTLKRGYGLHANYLKDRRFLGDGMVKGYLFHYGAFPALVLAENGPVTYGEVFECDQKLIDTLDGVEGVPDLYHRLAVRLSGHGPCWTYCMPAERIPTQLNKVIPFGRWAGPMTVTKTWREFLHLHSEFGFPTKPHTVWEPTVKAHVVNQPYAVLPPRTLPSWTADRYPVVLGPPEEKPKLVLPAVPEEAEEALEGMKVEWA